MTNFLTVISILIVLIVVVPALLTVAYVTVAERKTMASMQRRLGPNIVGYWGLLQAFADALKLLLKEYVSPNQANIILFFLGPIITLVFSLLGYGVVPYGPGLAIWDFDLGILYMLAVSSLATYGILLAGWSANSKYAFLGALRSTAQLISYELILSSAILLVILLTGSLNLTVNIEVQRAIWFTIPLLPIFIIFFIGSVAETNRAPFDLAEAESELVSGFMTEHAAVIFVFFFLAEYGSIVLICIFNSILFLGGYLYDSFIYNDLLIYLLEDLLHISIYTIYFDLSNNPIIEGLLYGTTLGIKTSIMVFTFIWVRASFPRIRFDQLMTYSWTMLLPIVIGFIILIPCNIFEFDIIPANLSLLLFWPFKSTNRNINLFKRFFEKKVKLWGIPINWLSLLISSVIAAVMSFVIRILLLQFWEFDLLDLTKDTGLKFLIVLSIIFIRKLIKELSEYLLIQYSQNIGNKNIFIGKMLAFRNLFTSSSSSSSSSSGNGEGTSNSTSINQTSITNVREASISNSNNSERSSSSSSSNRDSIRNNSTGNTVSSQDRNLINRGRTPNRILLPRRNTEFNRSRSPVVQHINYRDRTTIIQNPQPIGLNNTNRLLHNLGEVYYRPISPIRSFLVHGGVYHNNHPNYYLETFVSPDTDEAPQWRGRPNNIARLADIPLYEDNPDFPITIPRSNDPNITYPHTAFWAFVISDGVYATHMSNIPYRIINGNIIISDPNNVSRILPFDENNNFTYENYHPYIGNLWHVLEFYDAEYNMVPTNRRPLPVNRMGSNTLRFLQNIVESEYRGQPSRAGAMYGRNNITRFRLNQSIRNRLLVIYRNRRNETI